MGFDQHITEAEWQIMRAVWDKAPATSKDLVRTMNLSIAWEPTTVKTLLSRLVAKGALRFELKGRTYYYFPLVTEEECVRVEMKHVVEKVYGGGVNRETEHFCFKGDRDFALIDCLENELEVCFDRISEHLSYRPADKILVYTHATQKRLHSALGILEGPAWLRGGYLWGILHLAPKASFSDIAVEKVAGHLLTQLIINDINPQAPYWLQQGVSAYEGQWLTEERVAKALSRWDDPRALYSYTNVFNCFIEFRENNAYEAAYSVVSFIVSAFGFSLLKQFIKAPGCFETVFGIIEDEFWLRWRAYVNEWFPAKENN